MKLSAKLMGFSLIESIASLSIISIIGTVFLISLINHFNIGKDISHFKSLLTLDRVKAEIRKNIEPIEVILEREKANNQNIDYEFIKMNDKTFKINLRATSNSKKNEISETLILSTHVETE